MTGSLQEHLAGGVTTVARAWSIHRADGVVLGFTDHDRDLVFDGVTFRADSGLNAAALVQTRGLAVDNSEALGALSDSALREEEIEAGAFDGAEVCIWTVNWAEPAQRMVTFRGHIGDITREGGAFRAELRGVSEALNQPRGRVLQAACDAELGDARCGVDLTAPMMQWQGSVIEVQSGSVVRLPAGVGAADGWFANGRIAVLSGDASGQGCRVQGDILQPDGSRLLYLWRPLTGALVAGDSVVVTTGCDKCLATCRDKFANVVNFRGFPDIPSEDWVAVHPPATAERGGGSRR